MTTCKYFFLLGVTNFSGRVGSNNLNYVGRAEGSRPMGVGELGGLKDAELGSRIKNLFGDMERLF